MEISQKKPQESVRKCLNYSVGVLRVLGLYPRTESYAQDKLYAIYYVALQIGALGYLEFTIFYSFFTGLNDIVEECRLTVHYLFEAVLALIKGILIMRKHNEIKKFLKICDTQILQPKTAKQRLMFDEDYGVIVKVSVVFAISCVFMFGTWSAMPFFDRKNIYNLPIMVRLPYNLSNPNFYYWNIVHINFGVMTAISNNYATDQFIVCALFFIAYQFKILCDSLVNMYPETVKRLKQEGILSEDCDIKKNEELILVHMEDTLQNCIEQHKAILQCLDFCKNTLNWLLVVQFFASTLTLGINLFFIRITQPTEFTFFKFVSLELATYMELGWQCWMGNDVMVQSSNIPYAMFTTNWISASRAYKRKMLFFMMHTTTPSAVTALKLFPLSLMTFLAIVKSSMTYYTLLSNITIEK